LRLSPLTRRFVRFRRTHLLVGSFFLFFRAMPLLACECAWCLLFFCLLWRSALLACIGGSDVVNTACVE